MEQVISSILTVFGIYLAIGVLFAIVFLVSGLSKVDAGAKESTIGFKLLLFPGLVAFWLLFLYKWIKSSLANKL